jgi:hypothetical protein
MIPTLPIEVTCPQCGNKHVGQVQSIVDVGQDPQLKQLLLRGQLNTVVCPSCGALGAVSAPLLYHDPQKELLLLFFPPRLNLSMEDRERLTGSLVNALMSTLPAEERKGYFLNPRTVFTLQGLTDEILKADGVTQEMIDRQRARRKLLQDMMAAIDDEEQVEELIEQNKGDIDYSFFLTLAGFAEATAAAGQAETAEKLLQLRDVLLDRLDLTLPEPLPPDTPPSEVVDRVLEVKDEQIRRALVLYNRPLLDYAFFQELTRRIEEAGPDEAESLRNLRTELLEIVEELDREAQAAQQAKIQLLQDALAGSDPDQTLRERKEEIDALFLAILDAALRGAQERGETEEEQQLKAIHEAALAILQEDLPPELRLVNELLAAEYPQDTQQLLKERQAEWSAGFPEILSALADELEAQGRTESAQRLREIQVQAEAILQGSSSAVDEP